MSKSIRPSNVVFVSICLLALIGCDRRVKEMEAALLEAEKAKVELAEVQALLEKTRSQKDELQKNLSELLDQGHNDKSTLAAATQKERQLQNKIAELTAERNAATAEARTAQESIATLTSQLQEKDAEIQGLVEWMKEAQAYIQELESQIQETVEETDDQEYMDADANEPSDQEVADENNV
jgi:chromosome segregation ATPase